MQASEWNYRHYSKFLNTLPPYDASVIFRLWTGTAMAMHKRHQIYEESAACMCGCEDQTLQHVLWACPLVPSPPLALEYRRHLPSAQAVAHLLPANVDQRKIHLWKESCRREGQF